jgi:hypothetical protein
MSGRPTALLDAVATASEARDRVVAASPGRRQAEGIVHTPPALARFVADRADTALRERLGIALGLADRRVGLVDPAVGTGAFLAAAFDVAGARSDAPRACLGRDLDAAALDASRAALGGAFGARGWPLVLERVDTLGSPPSPPAEVAVVLGNPPWAARSGSLARAVNDRLLVDFRRDEHGTPLGEKKSGVLSDDYVRFFRWGAEVVRRASGGGVLALVTNGSFLDGPVHRAMRAALLRWFAWVDVVDLGGSALVARASVEESGGERDENVFAVRPSVAVTVATRPRAHEERLPSAEVRFTRLRGTRASKLARLGVSLDSKPLALTAPLYAFADAGDAAWPASAVPLPALFPFHREGVQTNRDEVAIDVDRDALLTRLRAFVSRSGSDEGGRADRALRHYDPARARAAVARALEADPEGARGIAARPIAYRPYDTRHFVPVSPLCHRPRPDLLAAMDRSSFALLTVRKDRGERAWLHFGASVHVPDNCFLSTRSSCRTRAFPTHGPDGAPNLELRAARAVFAKVGDVSVAGALDYALGLLASASYRATYGELLMRDYPRVIPPSSRKAYEAIGAAGAAVRAAFVASTDRGADVVEIGHHRVRPPLAFTSALGAAEAAVSSFLR